MEDVIPFLLGPIAQEPHIYFVLMALIFGGAFITSGFGVGGGVFMTPLIVLLFPPKFGIGLLGPMMLMMSAAGVRQYWKKWEKSPIYLIVYIVC